MTNYWHTWVEGYRARVFGIPKERNWYTPVRPNVKDSIQWDAGWDKADGDLNANT